MKDHLPPAAREMYEQIEELQDEAESVVARKEDAEARLEEAREALAALDGVDEETTVYRRVGAVRTPMAPDEARADLEETVDTLEARVDRLDETESDLRRQFEDRKEDMKHLLGGGAGDPTSPGTGN